MPATREDLDAFHKFAFERLAASQAEVELDELVLAWYDAQERGAVNSIIRQGLSEIDAGLGRPAQTVSEELRTKYGLTPE